jgi:hypothetical protein
MSEPFHGVLRALITPFSEDGGADDAATGKFRTFLDHPRLAEATR